MSNQSKERLQIVILTPEVAKQASDEFRDYLLQPEIQNQLSRLAVEYINLASIQLTRDNLAIAGGIAAGTLYDVVISEGKPETLAQVYKKTDAGLRERRKAIREGRSLLKNLKQKNSNRHRTPYENFAIEKALLDQAQNDSDLGALAENIDGIKALQKLSKERSEKTLPTLAKRFLELSKISFIDSRRMRDANLQASIIRGFITYGILRINGYAEPLHPLFLTPEALRYLANQAETIKSQSPILADQIIQSLALPQDEQNSSRDAVRVLIDQVTQTATLWSRSNLLKNRSPHDPRYWDHFYQFWSDYPVEPMGEQVLATDSADLPGAIKNNHLHLWHHAVRVDDLRAIPSSQDLYLASRLLSRLPTESPSLKRINQSIPAWKQYLYSLGNVSRIIPLQSRVDTLKQNLPEHLRSDLKSDKEYATMVKLKRSLASDIWSLKDQIHLDNYNLEMHRQAINSLAVIDDFLASQNTDSDRSNSPQLEGDKAETVVNTDMVRIAAMKEELLWPHVWHALAWKNGNNPSIPDSPIELSRYISYLNRTVKALQEEAGGLPAPWNSLTQDDLNNLLEWAKSGKIYDKEEKRLMRMQELNIDLQKKLPDSEFRELLINEIVTWRRLLKRYFKLLEKKDHLYKVKMNRNRLALSILQEEIRLAPENYLDQLDEARALIEIFKDLPHQTYIKSLPTQDVGEFIDHEMSASESSMSPDDAQLLALKSLKATLTLGNPFIPINEAGGIEINTLLNAAKKRIAVATALMRKDSPARLDDMKNQLAELRKSTPIASVQNKIYKLQTRINQLQLEYDMALSKLVSALEKLGLVVNKDDLGQLWDNLGSISEVTPQKPKKKPIETNPELFGEEE